MRLAIVGSREWKRLDWIDAFVDYLASGTVVITGGARGVDKTAEKSALAKGLEVRVFPADWDKYGKGAGFIRNQQIVDACDAVVAFWDGESNGTKDTLKKASAAKKPTFIFNEPWLTQDSQLTKAILILEKRVASGEKL
jgi:hypothetical protein